MGYDIDRTVSKIDEKFLCYICTMVLENPMQSPCEQKFSNDCIARRLKVQASCPVDSSALALDDMRPTPRYFRDLLEKIEIKCNFEPKGCLTIVPLEQLQHHLTVCVFNPKSEEITRQEKSIRKLNNELNRVRCKAISSANVMERQLEEIVQLSGKVGLQLQKIVKFNDEVVQQRDVITKLTDEVKRQREEITKLYNEQSCNRVESLLNSDMRGILDLDVLCLKKIFGFLKPINLCSLRQSCTQLRSFVDDYFHSLHYVREKWLDLTAENIGNVDTILQNFGKHVRHLKVREESNGQNLLLDVLRANGGATLKGLSLKNLQFYEIDMDKFDNLEILELIGCDGDQKYIDQFLSGHAYPNLKTLRIDPYHGREQLMEQYQLWKEIPRKFFMRKRSIKDLRCWIINSDILPLIVLNSSQIEELTIFPENGTHLMSLVKLEKLKRLEIRFCGCDQISIIALIKGLSVNNQLEMLGILHFEFTDEFCDALSNLTNLKELRLRFARCTFNNFKSLEILDGKLSKLESLMLVNCYDFPYRSFLASACKSDKFRTLYVCHWTMRKMIDFVEETVKDFTEGTGHRCFVKGDPLCIYLHKETFDNMKEFLTQKNLECIEKYGNIKIIRANSDVLWLSM